MDHVENYKQPKEFGDEDDITKQIRSEGCAPAVQLSDGTDEDDVDILPSKKMKKGYKTLVLLYI